MENLGTMRDSGRTAREPSFALVVSWTWLRGGSYAERKRVQ